MHTSGLRWIVIPFLAGTVILSAACGGGSDPQPPSGDPGLAAVPTLTPVTPEAPAVVLSPDSAECGVTFTIKGSGFEPFQPVVIVADPAGENAELAEVTPDRAGRFEARLLGFSGTRCVPGSSFDIVARAASGSGQSAETVFAVAGTPPPATPQPSRSAVAAATPEPVVASANTGGSTGAWGSAGNYTVNDGDTLWGIASTYGVSVEQLVSANHLSENTFLQPGDTLTIPGGS